MQVQTTERLNWNEICGRFPDEWVVLAEPDWVNDWDFEFGTAFVIGHRKHRAETASEISEARGRYREVGCFWTGEIRGLRASMSGRFASVGASPEGVESIQLAS